VTRLSDLASLSVTSVAGRVRTRVSAELALKAAATSPQPFQAPARRQVRPVIGVLSDGTAHFAPTGEVLIEDGRVVCHLCGLLFQSVTAHLRAHGWTKLQYCEAFGLERGQSLEGPDTRKLRSAAFAARLIFDPAIREGSAVGRARARAGDLTRADLHLSRVAAMAAARLGFADIGALVAARVNGGASLAAVSREMGQHKDWLCRHLPRLDPGAAELARRRRHQPDNAWLPALRRLGYPDVPAYLRDRHVVRHMTVKAIAAEAGLSHHAVLSALSRHGLTRTAHAAKRHAAALRSAHVASTLGFPAIEDYITSRRARGWTWNAICEESGQPQTWLRRHQGPAPVDTSAAAR